MRRLKKKYILGGIEHHSGNLSQKWVCSFSQKWKWKTAWNFCTRWWSKFLLTKKITVCVHILSYQVVYENESFNTLKVPENEEIYKVKLVSSSNGMMINQEFNEVLVSIKENDCPIR